MKYFIVFGNAPDLAREEVRAVLPHQELFCQPPVLILETEAIILWERFGGLVKVGKIIDEDIVQNLKAAGFGKIDFGVSVYEGKMPDLNKIKKALVEAGIKARFVLPKRRERILSSVVVRKQSLTEFLIFRNTVAKTIWSQDFEDWGKRDYGRPEVDPHIGMIPPKVARMMINIGTSGQVLGSRILDPFCGVGTILSEGLLLGAKVIGSDSNPNQIEKTKRNLEWISSSYNLEPGNYQAFVADARKVVIPAVDAIVTEPFLGPADPKILEALYYGCFAHWLTILKPGGNIVIATPFPIDKQKLMGYSLVSGPFMYFRPQAKVKRFIWHIQKLLV